MGRALARKAGAALKTTTTPSPPVETNLPLAPVQLPPARVSFSPSHVVSSFSEPRGLRIPLMAPLRVLADLRLLCVPVLPAPPTGTSSQVGRAILILSANIQREPTVGLRSREHGRDQEGRIALNA